LVVVLVFCVAGLTAMSMQVRCIDAAREAARLAARGDEGHAMRTAHDVAPFGAKVSLREEGELIFATVTAHSILLPGIAIRADSVAAIEPTAR
jgi:hypothetical protein